MDDTSTRPLTGGVAAPADARRHLRSVGADWGAGLLEDALLATSELVTNAVAHGGEHASLTVRTSVDTIRVEVYDSGRTPTYRLVPQLAGPREPRTTPDDEQLHRGGRGLGIVAVLSQRWGVTQQPTGKSVWFEMAARSAATPRTRGA